MIPWSALSLVALVAGGAVMLVVARVAGRSRTRGVWVLAVIVQWLAAYSLWAFAAGLARRHGLLEVYEPRVFAILAVIGMAVHALARGHASPWRARAVFVGGQALWAAVLVVQNAVIAHSTGPAPRILSGFGDRLGAEGFPRVEGGHRGVDVAGRIGSPVLATADGRVTVARDNRDSCGLIVVIEHEPHGYRTVYCHLSALAVKAGERVARGQRIGAIGTTGMSAWPGYEHVHWELQTGDVHQDPVAKTVGCLDGTRRYPADRLVLTYPVAC